MTAAAIPRRGAPGWAERMRLLPWPVPLLLAPLAVVSLLPPLAVCYSQPQPHRTPALVAAGQHPVLASVISLVIAVGGFPIIEVPFSAFDRAVLAPPKLSTALRELHLSAPDDFRDTYSIRG